MSVALRRAASSSRKGLLVHGDLPEDTPQSTSRRLFCQACNTFCTVQDDAVALYGIWWEVRVIGVISSPQAAAYYHFPASCHDPCERNRLLWTLILFFSSVGIR